MHTVKSHRTAARGAADRADQKAHQQPDACGRLGVRGSGCASRRRGLRAAGTDGGRGGGGKRQPARGLALDVDDPRRRRPADHPRRGSPAVGLDRRGNGRAARPGQVVGVLHRHGRRLANGSARTSAPRRSGALRRAVGARPVPEHRPARVLPRRRAGSLPRLAGDGHRRHRGRRRRRRGRRGRPGAGAGDRLHRGHPAATASGAGGRDRRRPVRHRSRSWPRPGWRSSVPPWWGSSPGLVAERTRGRDRAEAVAS